MFTLADDNLRGINSHNYVTPQLIYISITILYQNKLTTASVVITVKLLLHISIN